MVLKDKQDEQVMERKIINGETIFEVSENQNNDLPKPLNGKSQSEHQNANGDATSTSSSSTSPSPSSDILGLVNEINEQIIAGSNQLFQNMTETLENKLEDSNVNDASTELESLSKLLTDMTSNIQKAQQKEIRKQLDDIERKLVRPFEDIAFNDAVLFNTDADSDGKKSKTLSAEEKKRRYQEHRRELVIAGANSTLADSSRSLRTKEIVRNLNVAPFYYSVTDRKSVV